MTNRIAKISVIVMLCGMAGLLPGCGTTLGNQMNPFGSNKTEPRTTTFALNKLGITDSASLKKKGMGIVIVSGQNANGSASVTTFWSLHKKKKGKGGLSLPLSADSLATTIEHTQSNPRVHPVKAGHYNLRSFSFQSAKKKITSLAGMKGIYLASFDIKAGEVLYVGNLSVHTQNKFFGGLQKKFDLKVEDYSKEARAQLSIEATTFTSKMKTRLMKVSPVLNLVKALEKLKKIK